MDVGYARVSTREQDLGLQRDALEAAGVERICWEKVSSRKDDRLEFARRMLHDPETTVEEVASRFEVSQATIYRHVGAVKPDKESV